MKENDLDIHVQGTLPIAAFGLGQLIIFLTLIIFLVRQIPAFDFVEKTRKLNRHFYFFRQKISANFSKNSVLHSQNFELI